MNRNINYSEKPLHQTYLLTRSCISYERLDEGSLKDC